ncbi:hypothetical protein [Nocardia sp. NPDC050175]|uniref:hypothetical protein n=1 Tax=Nocardia sp. NPDC050175 TaxID=3364317 RepID=UPI00379A1AD4
MSSITDWASLIDRLLATRTQPNPGASTDDIESAAARLGKKLDPMYASFLRVADGWDRFDGSQTIYGTKDLAHSARWLTKRRHLDEFLDYNPEGLPEAYPHWDSLVLVMSDWVLPLRLAAASGGSDDPAPVVDFDGAEVWMSSDFHTWLTEVVSSWLEHIGQGAGIDFGIGTTGVQRADWEKLLSAIDSARPKPNPPASDSEIDSTQERLDNPLDPMFADFLRTADGWDRFDGSIDLYGTQDIAVSERWHTRNIEADQVAGGSLSRGELLLIGAMVGATPAMGYVAIEAVSGRTAFINQRGDLNYHANFREWLEATAVDEETKWKGRI